MKLSLRSNDVACTTQMMLCLAAQMKKSKSCDLDFLAGVAGFEPAKMPESKSGALPLGYTPII